MALDIDNKFTTYFDTLVTAIQEAKQIAHKNGNFKDNIGTMWRIGEFALHLKSLCQVAEEEHFFEGSKVDMNKAREKLEVIEDTIRRLPLENPKLSEEELDNLLKLAKDAKKVLHVHDKPTTSRK
jgi:hypothetical protein